MTRKRMSQKYWYCTDCPKTGSFDRRRPRSDRCSLFKQPNFFSAWSEGISLNDPEKNDDLFEWSANRDNRRCLQHRFQNLANSKQMFGNAYWFRQHLEERQRQRERSQSQEPQHEQSQTSLVRPNVYLAGGYSEYYKRLNKMRNETLMDYQNENANSSQVSKSFLKSRMPPEMIQQRSLPKSSNKTSMRDLHDPDGCLTENSKSIQSPLQNHAWRKERSLSPDRANPTIQFLHLSDSSLKPRYSLPAPEDSTKSPQMNRKLSPKRNQDEESSSRESSGTYAPQIADSTETTNGPLSLESRTSHSLLSVRSDEHVAQVEPFCPTSPNVNSTSENKIVTIPIITDPWFEAENHFEPNYLSRSTQSIFTASISKSPTMESGVHTNQTRTRRPAVCLFSVHRRNHHRDHVSSDMPGLSHSRDIGDRTAGNSVSELNNGKSCGSAGGPTRHCLLPNIYTTEAKSCTDLEEARSKNNALFQMPSTGSTLSPLPRSDLPDVYLNPPSMSSLQSQRSSPYIRSIYGLSDMADDLNSDTYSRCIVQTTGQIPNHKENSGDKCRRHSTDPSYLVTTGQWNKYDTFLNPVNGAGSSFDGRRDSNVIMTPTHSYNKSAFNIAMQQSPSTLFPPLFDALSGMDSPLSPIPVREKENRRLHQHLRRALSLTNRRRGPRSLSAEIQSIMNKHYEMTGIRLTTGASTNLQQSVLKSALNSFGSSQINFKSSQSRIWKRRCSWTVGKDGASEIQSNLKGTGSALHLDCTNLDLLNKFRPHKEKKSILTSLTTTALPCLVPLRSRLHSDSCSNGTSSSKTGAFGGAYFAEGQQPTAMRRSSSCVSKRNSLATLEKSLPLLGIHGAVRNVRSNVSLSEMAS